MTKPTVTFVDHVPTIISRFTGHICIDVPIQEPRSLLLILIPTSPITSTANMAGSGTFPNLLESYRHSSAMRIVYSAIQDVHVPCKTRLGFLVPFLSPTKSAETQIVPPYFTSNFYGS